MKIAINQPYFLPYLGYFQLIAAADLFVAYENVAYTRKSWISRNRLQGKAREPYFMSLPTVKTARGALIKNVHLHDTTAKAISKLLCRIRTDYAKAKCFGEVFGEIEEMFTTAPHTTLAAFNNHCLKWICEMLGLHVKLSLQHDDLMGFEDELKSSQLNTSFDIKSQRVFGLMSHFKGNHYLNLSGGADLYEYGEFRKNGLELDFLKIPNVEYAQFQDAFTPYLSILDTLLHCGVKHTRGLVCNYKFQQKPKGICS